MQFENPIFLCNELNLKKIFFALKKILQNCINHFIIIYSQLYMNKLFLFLYFQLDQTCRPFEFWVTKLRAR